jgi:hypothetical protein
MIENWSWENEKLCTINTDLSNMLEGIKEVISFSLVATEDPKGSMSLYSAILIYK